MVGVTKSTVRKWEIGLIQNMRRDKIVALCKVLEISPVTLLGLDEEDLIYTSANLKVRQLPYYDVLCCGDGKFIDDQIIDYVTVPSDGLSEYAEYFCQSAKGDSMIGAGIDDGDLLVFEKTSQIENGDISCFCIDENEAVCKKISIQNNGIILRPANPKYDPILIDSSNQNFRCVGKLKRIIKNLDN